MITNATSNELWPNHSVTTVSLPEESPSTAWHNSTAFTATLYFFMGLVVVLGMAGNGLVFAAITLRPHMMNVINYYIRNLAMADLLLLMIALPFGIVKLEFAYTWPLGKLVCEVIVPLSETFVSVSAWTMAVIAIERHRAIVFYRYNTSLKWPRIALAVTWFMSFLLASLPLLIVTKFLQFSGNTICFPLWPGTSLLAEQIFNLLTGVVFYLLPLSVILWTYVSISRKIYESKRFNKRMSRDLGNDRYKNNCRHEEKRIKIVMKAKKILTPVVLVFAITMFPLYFLKIIIAFYDPLLNYKYFTVLIKACFFLAIVNSACNPVIYSIVCKSFRREIKELLNCRNSHDTHSRTSSIRLSLLRRRRLSSDRSNL